MGLADEVRGAGVVLRRYRVEDADDVAAGCDDPLSQRFLPRLPSPYTRPDALDWITAGSAAAFADGGAAYAVADPGTDRLLGGAGLIQERDKTAVIGYWVAPWARGRGVATAAVRALTGLAFAHGVDRLSLRTEWENTSSQRVAIAAGFVREGVQRAGGLDRDGGRHDLIVWTRLRTDPDGPSHRLLPDLPGHRERGDGTDSAGTDRDGTDRDGTDRDGTSGDRTGSDGALTDGVVTLRPLGPRDADDLHALRSLPDVVATSVPATAPTPEEIARRSARSPALWLAGQRADLTIRDAGTDAFAGEIGLYYFEPNTQQAMIGYSMAPRWRGRGYATRAARLLAAWAFERTDIVRLIAGTAPDNLGSQRVLERAGFSCEGRQRSRLPVGPGRRIDDLLYSLLPPDRG